MDKIEKYMTKFKRSVETNPYTVITPATELDELEVFLQDNIFALGTSRCILLERVLTKTVF